MVTVLSCLIRTILFSFFPSKNAGLRFMAHI